MCQSVTVTSPCTGLTGYWLDSLVSGSTYRFYGSDTNANASFRWTFGDGTVGYSKDTTHSYSTGGTYTVCFYAYIPGSTCPIDSYCRSITVTGPTNCGSINGTWTYSQVSGTDTIHFTSTVDSTDWSNIWTLGDGNSASGPDPVHYYAQPGTYTVCRTITYGNTCHDTVCQSITITNPCPNLTAYWLDSLVSGTTFRFYASDTNTAAHHIWAFGDGSTDVNAKDTTHTYTASGTYTACLYVYLPGSSCPTDSLCRTITVNGCGTAAFEYYVLNGDEIRGYSTSTGTTQATNYGWTIKNSSGTVIFAQLSDTNNCLSQPLANGTYTLCLTLYNGNTRCDSVCESITVFNRCANLNANWTYYQTTNGTDSIQFNSSVDSTTWTYLWTFGDGTTSYYPNIIHHYSQPGTYTVCHIVGISSLSCYDTICQSVTVTGAPHCGTAVISDYVYGYNSIHAFDTATNNPTGTIYAWSIYGPNGNLIQSKSSDTSYILSIPLANGTYTVCLRLYTANNLFCDSVCTTVTIVNSTVCNGLSASWTQSYLQNGNVHFSPADSSSTLTYYWVFGDGTTSSDIAPTHAYSNGGLYHVCLYVSIAGTTCSDSSCANIQASAVNCNANYTYTLASNANNTVVFTNTSTSADSIVSYNWYFGDDSSATFVSGSHTYPGPGTYYTCLRIYTSNGCLSYHCDSITVVGTPCVGLSSAWTYTTLQNGNIQFRSTDTSSAVHRYWTFGDDSTNVGSIDPIHAYAHAGTYTVCLYDYIPGTNCFDSTCTTITVGATGCSAAFTYQSYYPPYNSCTFYQYLHFQ